MYSFLVTIFIILYQLFKSLLLLNYRSISISLLVYEVCDKYDLICFARRVMFLISLPGTTTPLLNCA